ncbi:hypothetical protein Fmac_024837 [Flemingia macrophylla]|uniref:Uncharacterized protein n=1 Tax=Flemingia macrophylla TaxID=520843 RepID=A0ABD1LQI0_9FABA
MSVLRLMLQTSIAGHHRSRGQTLDREDGFQLLAVSVQELMHLSFANLVTQLAVNQKPTSVARVCGIRSSNDHHQIFNARNDGIVIRGANDVATDTSAETRKVEGKLDTLVNLVARPVVNQKPACVARHPEAYAVDIYSRGVQDVATDTSVETRKVEAKLDALVNLVAQLTVNQKPTSIATVCGIRSSNDNHTNRTWLPTPSSFSARNDAIVIRGVQDVAIDTSAETRKVEGKQDALVNLVTQLAVNQNPTYVARVYGIRSSNDHHTNVFHDVAIDTSAETRKVDGKLDALVILVTQLTVNQKPASVARVCGIRSSNDHHTNVCPSFFGSRNDVIVIRGVHNVATDTSAETRKVEGKQDALMNLVTKLVVNQKPASVARVCGIRSSNDHQQRSVLLRSTLYFSARNDAIVIRRVHDVATDTFAETRKVEGKLYALVNMVSQLALNQKPISVARVYGIRSSNDHHTNDVFTGTSAETRKVEGKLDAPVNLVTQLALNQKPASVARVCGIRSSNDHHTNRRWLATPSSFSVRNDAIVIRGVHDVATDTSAENRKVEGKQDALVNLVTQLAVNKNPTSVAIVCGIRSSNDHHTNRIWLPTPSTSGARNDAIVFRGVHNGATDTSAETRKVEAKLDDLVNLVTQLAVNHKPTSIARDCHHSSKSQTLDREDDIQLLAVSVQEMIPLSLEEFMTWLQIHLLKVESFSARYVAVVIRGVHNVATDTSAETRKKEGKLDALVNLVTQLAQPGVNEHPEAYAANIYSRAPQQGVHDVATDTSTETRKGEGKLDALVNLVTQLAVNQKPTSVARQPGVNEYPEAYAANIYNTSAETREVEGKLDALVKLVTQLAVNQKPASVARVSHHNCRGQKLDREDDTSVETRKMEGKLDALVNMVTRLAVNQKPASVARHPEAYAANIYSRPPQQQRPYTLQRRWLPTPSIFGARNDANVIRGVHDVAIDTFAETGKVEGKLDALVNFVTQLYVNQKPASVASVCGHPFI